MRDKPRYDGHNRSHHPRTSMKDLQHRRVRRRVNQIWRYIVRQWNREATA